MGLPDPALPEVFTRAEALAAGLSSSQVKTRKHNGAWLTLRRGVYCRADVWRACGRSGRHLLKSRAALRASTGPIWLSHASAANVFGLPLARDDDRVWMTREPASGTTYLSGLVVEAATMSPADQRVVRGMPVTEIARTIADAARHLPPPDGLAIADAALRRDPTLGEGAARVLARCADWPYLERGRTVLALVDGRRESPLESWSSWEMHRLGLPIPEPQVELYDERGVFLGRVDAWWWEFGVAGEVDGRVKYAVPDDADAAQAQRALVSEKRREDLIRRSGAGMVRWGAVDLRRPERWADWLSRELSAHGSNRFRGRAVSTSPHTPGRAVGH